MLRPTLPRPHLQQTLPHPQSPQRKPRNPPSPFSPQKQKPPAASFSSIAMAIPASPSTRRAWPTATSPPTAPSSSPHSQPDAYSAPSTLDSNNNPRR